MRRRRLVRNPVGAWIRLGLFGEASTITAPSGPYSINTNYTFTVSTGLPGPTFDWTNQAGVTVVSGQGTSSAVIRFTIDGIRTIVVDITGSDGRNQRAAWIDKVSATNPTPPYFPSLNFTDPRNSQYSMGGF